MKQLPAISIKEPYAAMIRKGEKTIETRTWRTEYRGDIVICASQKPKSGLSGSAIAIVKIIDCRKMHPSDKDKAKCDYSPELFAWILDNIRPIKPIPTKGRLGIFEIDISPEYLHELAQEELF